MKTSKQLERYFKGAANHRRIEILFMVDKTAGIVLEKIAKNMNCNIKTVSEHTRRLVQAGLLNKKYRGREVMHSVSPYGKNMIKALKSFSYSPEYKNDLNSNFKIPSIIIHEN